MKPKSSEISQLLTLTLLALSAQQAFAGCGNSRPRVRWRVDGRCGPSFPLGGTVHGEPSQCDPRSDRPCCSDYGYCGNSASHCSCAACVDFRITLYSLVCVRGTVSYGRHENATEVLPANTCDLLHHLAAGFPLDRCWSATCVLSTQYTAHCTQNTTHCTQGARWFISPVGFDFIGRSHSHMPLNLPPQSPPVHPSFPQSPPSPQSPPPSSPSPPSPPSPSPVPRRSESTSHPSGGCAEGPCLRGVGVRN
ncbi:Chitin-binding type 1 [Trinorchestia longiramus]|nr:Chitin-binding type 1 [Trinorchestia longiramus]